MANIYNVIVYTSGLMGILFQVLAIGTKYWLVIHSATTVGTHTVDVLMKMSLVNIDTCVKIIENDKELNTTCQTITKEQMAEALSNVDQTGTPQSGDPQEIQMKKDNAKAAMDAVLGDFDKLPALMVLALICSVVALLTFTVQYCGCCSKKSSVVKGVSLAMWLIAVAFLGASVGISGHLNSFLSRIYDMASHMKLPQMSGQNISLDAGVSFPYSVLLAGISMGLCFLNTVAIAIDICVTMFKRSTDYWKYGRVHLDEGHDKVELMLDEKE